jgi:hypothetical protein
MVMLVILFSIGMKDVRAAERIEYIENLQDKINIEYDEETKEYIIKGINDGGLYIIYTIDMEGFADSEEAKFFVDTLNSNIGKETLDMTTITDEELQEVLDSGLGKCMNIDGRDSSISTSDVRVKENSIVSIDRVDDLAYKTYYYNDGEYKMDLYSITGTYAFVLEKKDVEQDTEDTEEDTEEDSDGNTEDTDKSEDKEQDKDNGENNESGEDTDIKENNKDNQMNDDKKQDDNENKSENKDNDVIKMDKSPKTGDFNTIIYGIICAIFSGCGIILISRKLQGYR